MGERLDFKLMPQLQTAGEAEATAQAILADGRLDTRYAVITLPPNCAVELYDVIRIHDSMAFQSGIDYRVTAAHFTYNSLTGNYVHRYYLCAV